ncbi:MAG: UDP-4-amino-4,6-dideoxy-N-acetyl-beta-L-altrosamine transaminase [Nitrospirota bacterium]
MEKFIPYGKQFIDEEDIREVVKVLRSDFITQGPGIKEFEDELAAYCDAKYAVVFNSGTSALHGAYYAAGLRLEDEFITTPNTFVATSNAGLYLGSRPVFVDIEADTGNIDASQIEDRITQKTKLIVPVHYAGHPAHMKYIREISQKYDLIVIEDACHAFGSRYSNERTGNCRHSDMTVFSFHPVKHITTGEGGAVLTNDKSFYEKLLYFRTHGISRQDIDNTAEGAWYYEMKSLGYNYRMTDIQAALGISQLKKTDIFLEKRRYIARRYDRSFTDNPCFDIPVEKDYAYSSYHIYPIRLKFGFKEQRARLFGQLRERGLGVQVHYIPVYLHPYYQNLGYNRGLCPISEDFYRREISIPIYPAMSDDDIDAVITRIRDVFPEIKP